MTKMTQEEWTRLMASLVTPPPLNERVTVIGACDYVTEDDHKVMRFYSGEPPPNMPRQL